MDFYRIYQDLFSFMKQGALNPWLDKLVPQLEEKLQLNPHGDLDRWLTAFQALPDVVPEQKHMNASRVGTTGSITTEQQQQLRKGLEGLIPWRKGPFELFGCHIDTEWHSDWKWDRVAPHLSSLKNRLVLDVGCGSGYHCWRMLGAGAERVIGIDPSYLFLIQFETLKKYLGADLPAHVLPVKMEDVTENLQAFDTVFSMGVLYHRRSPIDHLYELKGALRKGGELVLETLVIEGDEGQSLMPEDRYSMMRNVWFIPSTATLELWLRRTGFSDIRLVDLNRTSIEEQRATEWMKFQSLQDFLDPDDPGKTVEGYPAPLRATFIARK